MKPSGISNITHDRIVPRGLRGPSRTANANVWQCSISNVLGERTRYCRDFSHHPTPVLGKLQPFIANARTNTSFARET